MKKKSLGFKVAAGGTVALISFAFMGVLAFHKTTGSVRGLAESRTANIALNVADMIQRDLQQEIKIAYRFAIGRTTIQAVRQLADTGLENSGKEISELVAVMENFMKEAGLDYESIFITDANGVIFADSIGGRFKNLDVSDREYFIQARAGKINADVVVKSRISGMPISVVCAPVFSGGNSGTFLGSVALAMKIDSLINQITSIRLGVSGYLFLADREGIIIAHPDKKYILSLDLKTEKGMEIISRRMINHEAGFETYKFKGLNKIAGFAPIHLTGWSLCVSQELDEFMETPRMVFRIIGATGGGFMLMVLLGIIYFSRQVIRPLNKVICELGQDSEQMASVSGQVAAAGESQAQGSSDQAAAIQRASASLEQMAGMTRRNADYARQANALMTGTGKVVSEAASSMSELTVAMEAVSGVSAETSRIIKTIDEIAFQTNLLALNAAVEAARAGEAGAGFAVVAEEVRSLALRSAAAARNTSELIAGTLQKVAYSSTLATKNNEVFAKVAQSTKKVGELVEEIAAASDEQAMGVEQVNLAVSEMDKVTRQNAADAEDSAAVSLQLKEQARHLRAIVSRLVRLVSGSETAGTISRPPNLARNAEETRISANAKPDENIRSKQLIPLDDDDFADF